MYQDNYCNTIKVAETVIGKFGIIEYIIVFICAEIISL